MLTGKMKYYKIQYGYDEIQYLPIDATELPKAFAIFMEQKGRAIFKEGAVRGNDIIRIIPDWHKVKGWNQGYEMTPEDFAEIEPLKDIYNNTIQKAKDIAEFAIKEDRRDILELPPAEVYTKLPEKYKHLEIENKDVLSLASKFDINR